MKNTVYLGILDRFGYDLTVIEKSETELIEKMMREYEDSYKNRNDGLDPREANYYFADKSDYDLAKEDIRITEMQLGKVKWF